MSYKGSKAEKHSTMCSVTEAALTECFSKSGEGGDKFPEACADLGVAHLECAVAKREYAYQTAVELSGKSAVDATLPNYEESMKKAADLIDLYKNNAAGGKSKKEVFWG